MRHTEKKGSAFKKGTRHTTDAQYTYEVKVGRYLDVTPARGASEGDFQGDDLGEGESQGEGLVSRDV